MPDGSAIQTNFTAGELSPRVLGRTDFQRYDNGVQDLRNFIIQKHGGISKRPGTRFVASTRYQNRLARGLTFKFSSGQQYGLEVGHKYIRFFRSLGQLISDHAITAVDVGLQQVKIAGDFTASIGVDDSIRISGSTGNDGTYIVLGATFAAGETTITLNPAPPDATVDGQVIVPTTIAAPWEDDEIRDIKITQSGDIMYLLHPLYKTRELRRTAGDDSSPLTWQLVTHDNRDGPYLELNETATTLQPSATSGTITITASPALFVSTDVGRQVRIRHAGQWGWATITAFTSGTLVTASVGGNFGAITATTAWRLGSWSDTTGWPQCACFHQLRLYFGATTTQPQAIFASGVGNFTLHSPSELATDDVLADSGFVYTISDDEVNAVKAIKSDAKGVLIGTDGGAFIMHGGGDFTPITPTNVGCFRQTKEGFHPFVRPHQVGSVLLYIAAGARRLLELVWRIESERFVAPDISILSEHITFGGVIDMDYASLPDGVLWQVRGDGMLLALTYDREQNVIGWQRHPLGGMLSGAEQPAAESVMVVRDNEHDYPWIFVRRTIDGLERRTIEYIDRPFEFSTDQKDAFYVDCGASYIGAPVASIPLLPHLPNTLVSVLADGAVHAPVTTDANGAITLAAPASKVHAGFKLLSRMKTNPLVPGVSGFDPRGNKSRVYLVIMLIFRSLGGRVGFNDAQLDSIVYRDVADPMDTAVPLKTEPVSMPISMSHDLQATVTVEHDEPTPFNLLSVILKETVDGV